MAHDVALPAFMCNGGGAPRNLVISKDGTEECFGFGIYFHIELFQAGEHREKEPIILVTTDINKDHFNGSLALLMIWMAWRRSQLED